MLDFVEEVMLADEVEVLINELLYIVVKQVVLVDLHERNEVHVIQIDKDVIVLHEMLVKMFIMVILYVVVFFLIGNFLIELFVFAITIAQVNLN